MCCVSVRGGGGGVFFSDKLSCPVRKEIWAAFLVASILIIDIFIIILSINNALAFNLSTLHFNVTLSETRRRLLHLSYSMRQGACSDSPIHVNQVPSPQYTSNGWFSGTENPACVDRWISGQVLLLLLPWDWEQVKNLFIYRSSKTLESYNKINKINISRSLSYFLVNFMYSNKL